MTWLKTYDKKFRINKRTGKNYDLVLTKVDGLIKKLAKENYRKFRYLEYDDLYNELVCITIDGIKNFDRNKDTKFSTFLTVHLNNKLISMIRKDRKQGNNASQISVVGLNTEIPLSGITLKKCAHERGDAPRQYVPSNGDSLYHYKDPIKAIDTYLSVMSIIKKFSKKDKDAIIDVFFNDVERTKIAKKWGCSPYNASVRILKPFRINSKSIYGISNDLKIDNDYNYPKARITKFAEADIDRGNLASYIRDNKPVEVKSEQRKKIM